MGAVVFLTLLASIPVCVIAALLWARASKAGSAEEAGPRLARAARWTALALGLQALSFFATAYVALFGAGPP